MQLNNEVKDMKLQIEYGKIEDIILQIKLKKRSYMMRRLLILMDEVIS